MEYLTENELIEINRRIILQAGEGSIGHQDAKNLNSVVETPNKFSLDVRLP